MDRVLVHVTADGEVEIFSTSSDIKVLVMDDRLGAREPRMVMVCEDTHAEVDAYLAGERPSDWVEYDMRPDDGGASAEIIPLFA